MKERPILFSGPMVRAILDGRKMQTRRVVKRQRDMEFDEKDPHFGPYWLPYVYGEDSIKVPCPYGNPGDRLWVREQCRAEELKSGLDGVRYAADDTFISIENSQEASDRWCDLFFYAGKRGANVPSIHMPRWASRINLEVTGVRVERLQDISEADAKAEGAQQIEFDTGKSYGDGFPITEGSYVLGYHDVWESINGPGSWAANPWVWVVEFKRVE